ncbi:hypothetical protein NVP1084O_005 [Vibrio phage 1.084.O._10N.261.49.F5]|nr:hypothetical protein NVP1084O_005 [Vibrio phage 1.084.O._10N.261.49.F5]
MEKKMKEVFNLPLKHHEPPVKTGRNSGYPVISASISNKLPCGMIGKIVIEQGTYSGTSPYMDETIAEEMAQAVVHAINSHDELVEKLELYRNYIEHYVLKELQPNNPVATVGEELLAMK